MSVYNQEFNKDNNILRYVIVATLAELRNKVYFYNQVDEDTLKKIEVPFFYSVTGNERFLADNFIYDIGSKAIGDYETVPRGMVQLNSLAIDSGSQTNKFTRGEFVREWNGQLKTFALQTNFLPLSMSFGVTVVCSNNLEMLKATEAIMSRLYKSTSFNVDLGMFRVEASIGVPEDYSQDRLFEFALNDKKEFNVTFDIEVKSFVPVFENGIVLDELEFMTKQALDANPDAGGTGLLRSDADGNLGIYFGGTFQKFEYSVDDIRIAPIPTSLSNTSYISPDSVKTDGPFIETDTTSAPIEPEPDASKEYRNGFNEDSNIT